MTEHVTIVGAGIVGICTALSLLEKGFTVELIDRDLPAEGASYGNAGVVSPWSCVPQSMPGIWKNIPKWTFDPEGPVALRWSYIHKFLPWAIKFLRAGSLDRLQAIGDAMNALNRPNVDLYRHHLNGTGHEKLLSGSMYVHVYKSPIGADLNQLGWRMRSNRDVPLQVINGDELHEIEPDISLDYKSAVLIKDQARALDPGAVGKALFEKAVSMGATYRRASVDQIKPISDGKWVLQTSDGELQAEKLIIAAGAWSAHLLAPLGLNIPLEAERGYHIVLQNPNIVINNSIMDTEGKFVASSMLTGVRCAGTAEFAGLDAAPDYRRAKVFIKLAKKLFPAINAVDAIEWMGTRPSFPDSLPCLGKIPGHANIFSAFGHSHYGFGMAPNTGRVMAQIISGETPNINLSPYQIERFQ
jgi:D-amino-acid dehydrogenase